MTTKDIEKDTGKSSKPAPLLFSSRLAIFLLFLTGTTQFLLQRFNINFALVCMVKNPTTLGQLGTNETNITGSLDVLNIAEVEIIPSVLNLSLPFEAEDNPDYYECKKSIRVSANGSLTREGEFEWSKDVQGAILGSFFYGFVFTQIPGGWISDRFGGKIALLVTSIIFSVITMLHPLFARFGPEYLFGLRVIQGLSHGLTLPCINVISVRWSGPTERGFLMGIAYGGFSVGAVLTFPLCALICEKLGWPFIFYITGGIGVIWCVAVYFFLFDTPEDHPRISAEELEFLQKNRAVDQSSSKQKLKVPWMKIFLSVPVNALHAAHFCTLWGFQTLSMYLPSFMKEVLFMDVSTNGLVSSLPYVGMLVLHVGVGRFFDTVRAKNLCSITTLRKIFNTFGTFLPGISLLSVYFLTCRQYLGGIFAIAIGQAFIEFAMMGGYLFSVFELAPRFAGILTGIMNTYGVLTGLLCPIAVSYLTPNGTREEWLVVFYVAAGIVMVGCVVYLFFGSSELQEWAKPPAGPRETELKMVASH
ncbi:unnamed protein product [Allacma fusca]|uniref:Major facilitator superfamily (MFS) profile domain-containing protein n=1 Tax=Allacma fusca TaxID=39272 RepID=A0A8J2P3D4_9HEXA|nr:unnamed protein product [Allacma fusca]